MNLSIQKNIMYNNSFSRNMPKINFKSNSQSDTFVSEAES